MLCVEFFSSFLSHKVPHCFKNILREGNNYACINYMQFLFLFNYEEVTVRCLFLKGNCQLNWALT